MAAFSDRERREAWAEIMQVWPHNRDETNITKTELRDVFNRVTTTPEFEAARPEVLHEQRFDWGLRLFPVNYDVAPGAERFVVVADRSMTELKVVFNWFEEHERLVPTN